MTSYIPSLTLPAQFFANPTLALIHPLIPGLGLSFFIPGMIQQHSIHYIHPIHLLKITMNRQCLTDLRVLEETTFPSSFLGVWASMDGSVPGHGRGVMFRLDDRNGFYEPEDC